MSTTATKTRTHAATTTSPRDNDARHATRERQRAEKRRAQLADHLASGAKLWKPKKSNGLTFVDIFCGAGGSSIGLSNAGYRLLLAANHWQTAIDTHAANFSDSEHLCADVNNYDFRYLPRGADVLWASPICTEASPAGGTSGYKRDDNAPDMVQELGHVSQKGMTRTRATFYDVLRATEIHRFKAVIIENVPDVVTRWELFDLWLASMDRLGYHYQLVSVNSAHVGGDDIPHAPQWRDRLYIVFIRKDVGRVPDVDPRPVARCFTCSKDVKGVQTWAPSMHGKQFRVGRYRRKAGTSYGQYWYTCPNRRCGQRVEPYILPAVAAIDLTDPGVRIGDLPRTKDKPEGLAPKSMRRIREGLRIHGPRAFTATGAGEALTVPPMLVPSGGTWAEEALNVLGEPARTVMANEKGCESLVTPEPFLAMLRNHGGAVPVRREPMPTLTAAGTHHALIVPYYSTGEASTTAEPLGTVSTHDRFAMVSANRLARMVEVDAMDAFYRMLYARESLRAQTFPEDYIVLGGSGEQTMQAGNAVSCNAAQWLGERVAAVLTPAGVL